MEWELLHVFQALRQGLCGFELEHTAQNQLASLNQSPLWLRRLNPRMMKASFGQVFMTNPRLHHGMPCPLAAVQRAYQSSRSSWISADFAMAMRRSSLFVPMIGIGWLGWAMIHA